MIKFETISGKVIEIRSASDQDAFELSIRSKDSDAHFYVGDVCYFVRCVAKYVRHRGVGHPLEKKKLY